LPESEWLPGGDRPGLDALPTEIGGKPYRLNVCPRFVCETPLCQEALLAVKCIRKPGLPWDLAFGDDVPAAVVDAGNILDSAYDEFEQQSLADIKKR